LHLQQQVGPALALSGQADHLPRPDPARHLHLERAPVDVDAHGTAAVHGLQRHRQARAGLAARARAAAEAAAARRRLPPEQALEEVAEATAPAAAEHLLEVEGRAGAIAAEATRRRMDVVAGPVAASAQLVVGLAPRGVAQRLVGLVHGLELVLRPGLLADVGVVLAGEAPVGGLDLGVAGAGCDAEDGVIVLELHAVSTCAAASGAPAAAG